MCDRARGRDAARNLLYFSSGGVDPKCDTVVWGKAVEAMESLSNRGLAECWLELSRSVAKESSCNTQQVLLLKLKVLFEMAMKESTPQNASAQPIGMINDTLERSILLAEQFWNLVHRVDELGKELRIKYYADSLEGMNDDAGTPLPQRFSSFGGSDVDQMSEHASDRLPAVRGGGDEALRACCDKLAAMMQEAGRRQMERLDELERGVVGRLEAAFKGRMDELERGVVGRLEAAFKGRMDELERGVVGKLEAAFKERMDELERGVVGRLEAAFKGRMDELERGVASRLDAAIRAATEARPAAADPPPVPRAPDSTTVRPAAGGIRPAGHRTVARTEPSRNSLSPEHSRGSIVHEPVFRPAGVVDYSRADNDIYRMGLQYCGSSTDRQDALRTDTERFTSPTSPFSSPRRSASRLA